MVKVSSFFADGVFPKSWVCHDRGHLFNSQRVGTQHDTVRLELQGAIPEC